MNLVSSENIAKSIGTGEKVYAHKLEKCYNKYPPNPGLSKR